MIELKPKISLKKKQESLPVIKTKDKKLIWLVIILVVGLSGLIFLFSLNDSGTNNDNGNIAVEDNKISKTETTTPNNNIHSTKNQSEEKNNIETQNNSVEQITKNEKETMPLYKPGINTPVYNFENNVSKIDKRNDALIKLVNFLKANPNSKIKIDGFTDNTGEDYYNFILSKERALSVFNYLKKQGIASNRMTYKGKGEQNPIDSNSSEEGRLKNRRVEFTVL